MSAFVVCLYALPALTIVFIKVKVCPKTISISEMFPCGYINSQMGREEFCKHNNPSCQSVSMARVHGLPLSCAPCESIDRACYELF